MRLDFGKLLLFAGQCRQKTLWRESGKKLLSLSADAPCAPADDRAQIFQVADEIDRCVADLEPRPPGSQPAPTLHELVEGRLGKGEEMLSVVEWLGRVLAEVQKVERGEESPEVVVRRKLGVSLASRLGNVE